MGDDNDNTAINAVAADFYPRPPYGGRPHARPIIYKVVIISIHVPRMGDDAA